MRIGVVFSELKRTKSSEELFEILDFFKTKGKLITVLSNPESYYFEKSVNSKFFVQGVDSLKPRFNIFKIRSVITVLKKAQFEHIFVADRYSLKILLFIKKITDLDFRIHTFFDLFAKNRYHWIIRRNRKWISTINPWVGDEKSARDNNFKRTKDRIDLNIEGQIRDKEHTEKTRELQIAKQKYLEDVYIHCFPQKIKKSLI